MCLPGPSRSPLVAYLLVSKSQDRRYSRFWRCEDDVVKSKEARDGGTAARALDVAERLVQVRGFNAFSYADVSRELGLSTAALHYHFAGKAELGEALIV